MIREGEWKGREAYRGDLGTYTEEVLENYGVASQSAEREIIRLADMGNCVALKLYADMIFYGKIIRKDPYVTAFELYLRAAGIVIPEDTGEWMIGEKAYPPALWATAYYLLDYRRGSVLQHCGEISCIEAMSRETRLKHAFLLAVSCIRDTPLAGALNLLGRVLQECAEDEALFKALRPELERQLSDGRVPGLAIEFKSIETQGECGVIAEEFFRAAASEGYVYACNNLAAREAARIVKLYAAGEDAKAHIEEYISALAAAADRYEPYAANRLGLFYITGEIKSETGKALFPSYVDHSRAKECFRKACVCPDKHSAWAYYNLLKYYPRDYEKDIDLMNEHMDQIKLLDPEVYDLAMEL